MWVSFVSQNMSVFLRQCLVLICFRCIRLYVQWKWTTDLPDPPDPSSLKLHLSYATVNSDLADFSAKHIVILHQQLFLFHNYVSTLSVLPFPDDLHCLVCVAYLNKKTQVKPAYVSFSLHHPWDGSWTGIVHDCNWFAKARTCLIAEKVIKTACWDEILSSHRSGEECVVN